ncbi:hypothetical protein BJX70DRAFT_307202 [Aspergillus crustosus]
MSEIDTPAPKEKSTPLLLGTVFQQKNDNSGYDLARVKDGHKLRLTLHVFANKEKVILAQEFYDKGKVNHSRCDLLLRFDDLRSFKTEETDDTFIWTAVLGEKFSRTHQAKGGTKNMDFAKQLPLSEMCLENGMTLIIKHGKRHKGFWNKNGSFLREALGERQLVDEAELTSLGLRMAVGVSPTVRIGVELSALWYS